MIIFSPTHSTYTLLFSVLYWKYEQTEVWVFVSSYELSCLYIFKNPFSKVCLEVIESIQLQIA